MNRLATSLGTLIALMAVSPAAEAGSYAFSIGGHRFRVESPSHCRSTSCVSVSSNRSFRPDTTPAPALAPPQPAYPVAPVRPAQAIAVSPASAPTAPVLASTTSQPVILPQAASSNPPRVELPRMDPPKTVALDPPRMEASVVAPRPEIKQAVTNPERGDDEPAYLPLGEWESAGAKGTVRIERCGPALCGYALTEASSRGESVLVNMKPKTHDVWTGNIYSRSSGSTYYATMTLQNSGKLHVEACALGHFWCTGNDWTRAEERPEKLITTSRQWSARS
ncbi:DUF2147 domain-containing protein [Bradyrhizobium canariense]|uniref:DUF2147 domain-containing protein n=1 Tax=Bradyrhizobium canariense TaxID=255045 RepID=UPI001B8A2D41|nr:DUF2147 domain-containing protein [Bradyrhizobium canariense]MBR0952266.1 DUF2147 domain-containing protein [Bradyrhizobium canariense]